MPNPPRGHLGHESSAAVMAAAVTADLYAPTYRFVVSLELRGNAEPSRVHTENAPCTRLGARITLPGADIVDLVDAHTHAVLPPAVRGPANQAPANRKLVLCKKCAQTPPGVEDLRDLPGSILGLHRLAAARRVTAQLAALHTAYRYDLLPPGKPRQRADLALGDFVGEARLFLAQYETHPDDPGHQALVAAKAALEDQLDQTLQSREWATVHAKLVARTDGTWVWTPLRAYTPSAGSSLVNRSYGRAVSMFAVGATLETYAPFPTIRRPVIRHLSGCLSPRAEFVHRYTEASTPADTSVPENGRSREVMRLAFSTATPETLSAPGKREAWFAAVQAACTPAPAEN